MIILQNIISLYLLAGVDVLLKTAIDFSYSICTVWVDPKEWYIFSNVHIDFQSRKHFAQTKKQKR